MGMSLLREEVARVRARRIAITVAAVAVGVAVLVAVFAAFKALRAPKRGAREGEDVPLWQPSPQRFVPRPPPPPPPRAVAAEGVVTLLVHHPMPCGHVWCERTLDAARRTIASAIRNASNARSLRIVCMDATLRLRDALGEDGVAHLPSSLQIVRPPLHELPHRIVALKEQMAALKGGGGGAAAAVHMGVEMLPGWDESVRTLQARLAGERAVLTCSPSRSGRANRFPIVGALSPRSLPLLSSTREAHRALKLLPSVWADPACILGSEAVLSEVVAALPPAGVAGGAASMAAALREAKVAARYASEAWCRRGGGGEAAPSLEDLSSAPEALHAAILAEREAFEAEERQLADAVWAPFGDRPERVDVRRFFLNVSGDVGDAEVVCKYGSEDVVAALEEDISVRLALHAARRMREGERRREKKKDRRKRRKGEGEGRKGEERALDLVASLDLVGG